MEDTLERPESGLGPHEVLVAGKLVHIKRKSTAALMFALLAACFAFQLNASMLSPALKGMETQLNATTAQVGLTQTAFFAPAAVSPCSWHG